MWWQHQRWLPVDQVTLLLQGLWRLLVAALACTSLSVGAQDESGPTLSKIAAQGRFYIGYREVAAPFTFAIPGKTEPVGYLWDVCRQVVVALEARLGKPLEIVPVAVTDNSRTMLIKNNVVDLDCGGAANTVAREKQVTLSNTVYVSEIKVLVRSDSDIASVEQLAGKRVVTVTGGSERQIKRMALEKGVVLLNQLAYSPVEAMALLSGGKTDAFVAEDATLSMQRAGKADFRLLDVILATEPQALMLPLGDQSFKKLVDDVLVSLMVSGELARLYDKWFLLPIPPDGVSLDQPMSAALKAAIRTPDDTPVN